MEVPFLLQYSFLVSIIFTIIKYHEDLIESNKNQIRNYHNVGIGIESLNSTYEGSRAYRTLNRNLRYLSHIVLILTIGFILHIFNLLYCINNWAFLNTYLPENFHKHVVSVILFLFCVAFLLSLLIKRKFNKIRYFLDKNTKLT